MAGIVSTLLLARALHVKANDMGADPNAEHVRAITFRPLKMIRLANHVDDFAAAVMPADQMQALMDATSGADDMAAVGANGQILAQLLAFINAHWSDIWPMIAALLGIVIPKP